MHSRFGQAFSAVPLAERGTASRFMKAFTVVKHWFSKRDRDERYRLPLELGVEDSEWYMEGFVTFSWLVDIPATKT